MSLMQTGHVSCSYSLNITHAQQSQQSAYMLGKLQIERMSREVWSSNQLDMLSVLHFASSTKSTTTSAYRREVTINPLIPAPAVLPFLHRVCTDTRSLARKLRIVAVDINHSDCDISLFYVA